MINRNGPVTYRSGEEEDIVVDGRPLSKTASVFIRSASACLLETIRDGLGDC